MKRYIEVGDRILLNDKAPKWTNFLIFTVKDVLAWRVLCYTRIDGARKYYEAHEEEIQKVLS